MLCLMTCPTKLSLSEVERFVFSGKEERIDGRVSEPYKKESNTEQITQLVSIYSGWVSRFQAAQITVMADPRLVSFARNTT